jgi:hypothetical protein
MIGNMKMNPVARLLLIILGVACSGCTNIQSDRAAPQQTKQSQIIDAKYELMRTLPAKDIERLKKEHPSGFSFDYDTGFVSDTGNMPAK